MAGFYLELKWKEEGDMPLCLYQRGNLLFFAEQIKGVDVLEFRDSFLLDGIYCFLPHEVKDLSPLTERLVKIYKSHYLEGLRFLWIADLDCIWKMHGMYGIHKEDGIWLAHSVSFPAGTGALTIEAGVRIICGDGCFLLISGEGSGYSCRIGKVSASPLPGTMKITAGDEPAGCFRFKALAEAGIDGIDVLERMDAGLRYICLADENQEAFDSALTGHKGMYQTPLFYAGDSIILDCSWNPAALYDSGCTYFCIEPGTRLHSFLMDWVGKTLEVLTGEHSVLVFERSATALYTREGRLCTRPRTCLGISGEYQLISSGKEGGEWVLCGLGGTEFIDMKGTDHIIRFVPGQAGFAGKEGVESLTDVSYVIFPQQSGYICQPQKSPFFSEAGQEGLDFFPVPSFRSDREGPVQPFFLYDSVRISGACAITEKQLEELLYRERMRRYPVFDTDFPSGEKKLAVTPQGLMVQMEIGGPDAGRWEWIGLAQTKERKSQLPDIRFTDISHKMRQDFQNLEMMVLYEDQKELMNLAGVPPEFGFCVDGWRFLLKPEQWWDGPNHPEKTVLILKYGTAKSIREWLMDSPVMERSIRQAHEADYTPKEDYREFLDIIGDPDFQGIMFLNCPVEVDKTDPGFLKEFTVILDSIQADNLYAHHLILYRSRIDKDNGTLSMAHSDVSALIDYGQDGKITYRQDSNQEPYQFTTRKFLMAVQEGRLSKAESLSELMVSRFFESPVIKAEGTEGYSLVILGELQEAGGIWEFLYRLSKPGEFTLKGSAVQCIRIDSVTMNAEEGSCSFYLGGRLFFILNEKGDVFSYGYASGESEPASKELRAVPGLRYSGLLIIKESDGMTMKYGSICIDALDSTPRYNGMAACFPAVPVGFLTGLSHTPDEEGFVSMTAPITQEKVSAPWFGTDYEITLGGLGALADADPLAIHLLFAWSPGEDAPSFYAGIKLPGSGQIKIQGIFAMEFSSMTLRVDQSGPKHLYTLILNQFAVRIMGLSFPKGENRMYLTAGPDGRTLGWYAYYKEDVK